MNARSLILPGGSPVAVLTAILATLLVLTVPSLAQAEEQGKCQNASLRVGASTGLPDCRVYELVTPADKSSANENLEPTGSLQAVAGADGDRVALQAFFTTFGETPMDYGSFSVFERGPEGWATVSVPPANAGAARYYAQIFTPDLSHVGVYSETLGSPGTTFQVGVPGGPFTAFPTVAGESEGTGSHEDGSTRLLGSSPDFSHVVLASTDHTLLSATPTGTAEHAYDLYELTENGVRLLNVSNDGAVLGQCGATLGDEQLKSSSLSNEGLQPDLARNAVSADGSKVFFTSPDPLGEGEGCPSRDRARPKFELDAPQLYMRVTEVKGGAEEGRTVNISAPQGVSHSVAEEEEEGKMPVLYGGASRDGAKVFFVTERALTSGAVIDHPHLYDYDTQAPEGERLKLIFEGGPLEDIGVSLEHEADEVLVSADGSAVYFYRGGFRTLYRYESADGGSVHEIASMSPPNGLEQPQVSPDGQFFLFASEGVEVQGPHGFEPESRGFGHNELYRYSSVDGSIVCVSCGPGAAPATGNAFTGFDPVAAGYAQMLTPDQMPEATLMSTDGSRVFFESEAALTPQVTNVGALNVYEWEADGAGSCDDEGGCTYLISRGNSARETLLIGASEDGSNVFFLTQAQLVPQDRDSSFDIYDARVNGGFSVPSESVACLGDTCQSVPPPVIDPTLASSASSGPGNPAVVSSSPSAGKPCEKGEVQRKGKCVRRRGGTGKAKRAKRAPGRSRRRGAK